MPLQKPASSGTFGAIYRVRPMALIIKAPRALPLAILISYQRGFKT